MEEENTYLKLINEINEYQSERCLTHYEPGICQELLAAIDVQNHDRISYFLSFGDHIRAMTFNLYAHRKALTFGFTEITFNEYGWFQQPRFLESEDIVFGSSDRYGEYSTIHIGRGNNNVWTYSLSYSFGTAGGACSISIYGKQFPNRSIALEHALADLKSKMQEKIGNTDTCNYKQTVILSTLRDIEKYKVSSSQLQLFA